MKVTTKKLRETISKIILFENRTNEDKILELVDTADPAYVQQGIELADTLGLINLFEEERIESRGFGSKGSKVYRFFCLSPSFYAKLNKMQYKHQGQSYRSITNMLIECYGGNEVYIRVFDTNLTQDPKLDAFIQSNATETRMYAGSLIKEVTSKDRLDYEAGIDMGFSDYNRDVRDRDLSRYSESFRKGYRYGYSRAMQIDQDFDDDNPY